MREDVIAINSQIIDTIKFIVSTVSPLIAGYIGVKYGLKQIKTQKSLDFYERQIREFYSPMLGCQKEIRARSEVRLKINNAASTTWKDKFKENSDRDDKDFHPYERILEYNNSQLENELIPLYKKMLSIFSNNFWLAQPETRKWYPELCEFVEIWQRSISESIPGEVIEEIGHSEKKLYDFYEDLENQLNILIKRIS